MWVFNIQLVEHVADKDKGNWRVLNITEQNTLHWQDSKEERSWNCQNEFSLDRSLVSQLVNEIIFVFIDELCTQEKEKSHNSTFLIFIFPSSPFQYIGSMFYQLNLFYAEIM